MEPHYTATPVTSTHKHLYKGAGVVACEVGLGTPGGTPLPVGSGDFRMVKLTPPSAWQM